VAESDYTRVTENLLPTDELMHDDFIICSAKYTALDIQ